MRSRPQVRHLIVSLAVQNAPGRFLISSTPLLEEESRSRRPTHRFDLIDPLRLHFASARAALSTYDRPMDAAQISFGYGPDQRLKGNKSDCSRHPSNSVQPIQNATILNAGAEPNVREDFERL